jgi:DNA-binding MarR family transcriptional regulator
MTEPRWLEPDEDRAWRAFVVMARALDLAVERQFQTAGLSSADFQILAALSESEAHTLRVRDLGAGIGWDRSRIAHQLRRMEQRGLVARFDCASDGRGIMVRLTDDGLAAVEAVVPGHVDMVRRIFIDQLSPADLEHLPALFTKMAAAARAEK